LRLVEKTKDANPSLAHKTATQLAARLEDYDSPRLASAQRRFAMTELRRLSPDVALPTRSAEDLSAEAFSAEQLERLANRAAGEVLRPAGGSEVWTVASPQRRVIALFHAATVRTRSQREAEQQTLPAGVRLAVVEPNEVERKNDEFLSAEIGPSLPLWHMSLSFDEDPFAGAAAQRGRFYLWTAVVTIIATTALAALTAAALRRQMRQRQARELKTRSVPPWRGRTSQFHPSRGASSTLALGLRFDFLPGSSRHTRFVQPIN